MADASARNTHESLTRAFAPAHMVQGHKDGQQPGAEGVVPVILDNDFLDADNYGTPVPR